MNIIENKLLSVSYKVLSTTQTCLGYLYDLISLQPLAVLVSHRLSHCSITNPILYLAEHKVHVNVQSRGLLGSLLIMHRTIGLTGAIGPLTLTL